MRMAENCIVVRVNKIDGLKSGPNFPRVAQKVASAVLPYNVKSDTVFQKAQKSPSIWATIVIKFIAKNFQKSPNLVTVVVASFNVKTET